MCSEPYSVKTDQIEPETKRMIMAETIVMIHGMWGGGWYWENYKNLLEQRGFQCHTPTLRHHDMDPNDHPDPGLGTTSLLDYARDLEVYIYNLDQKPFLMGHSMGGLLAQILGARGLAKGLVLLTPASPRGINALNYSVIKSFWSVLARWGFWRKPHRLSFEASVYAMLHLLPAEEQKAAYDRFVYESGRAASEIGFWLFDSGCASKVDHANVSCPVLVVSGSEDRITPAAVVQKAANKYKALSTYKEFENHAHWVIGEPGWEEIAEFAADWLKQISG
jgi:pimeloyl-ACP methyl ester carboxylesterase